MVFNRHKGKKWLAEILDDVSDKLEEATGYGWMKKTAPEASETAISWSAQIVRRASIPLTRMSAMFGRTPGGTGGGDNVESDPPLYPGSTVLPIAEITIPMFSITSPTRPNPGRQGGRDSAEASGRPSDASPIPFTTSPPSTPEPTTDISAARARFMNLVRSAIMVNRLIGIGDEARAKVSRSLTDGKATDRKPAEIIAMPRSSRVAGLVPRLRNMAPTQDIAAHTALVRHMQVSVKLTGTFVSVVDGVSQFSPDGKFLATSSWDRTSVIFHVGVRLIHGFYGIKPNDLVGAIHIPSYIIASRWIRWSGCMVSVLLSLDGRSNDQTLI